MTTKPKREIIKIIKCFFGLHEYRNTWIYARDIVTKQIECQIECERCMHCSKVRL